MLTGFFQVLQSFRHMLCAVACLLMFCTVHAHAGLWQLQSAVRLDPLGKENIETIQASSQGGEFVAVSGGFSSGYTRQVHWVRLSIQPPKGHAGDAVLAVLPSFLDDVRLYWPVGKRSSGEVIFEERAAGDLQPFSAREIEYRGHAFALHVEDDTPVVAYMRLQTTSSLIFFPRLEAREDFFKTVAIEYVALGLSYGILVMVLTLHLWSGLWRKEPAYRLYLMYVAVFLLHALFVNGVAAQFLTPGHPDWTNQWTTWLALLSMSTGAAFYQNVLSVNGDETPRLVWIFRLAIWGPWCAGFALLFDAPYQTLQWVGSLVLVMAMCGLGRSIQLLLQGRSGSRFLVLAHMFSLAGGFAYLLLLLGALPVSGILLHSYQFSNLMALIALNFSLISSLRDQQRLREFAEREMALAQQSMARETALREEQTQFMAMMSHEIKNPLATIEAAADALQDLHPGLSDPERMRLERIHRGVAQIDRLLNQLIRQDHVNAAANQMTVTRVDLRQLCGDAMEATDQRERVRFSMETDPLIQGDPLWLRLALDNLLDNALKYGGGDSPVELVVQGDRRWIQLDVSDRGAGIPPDLKQKVFDRYFRSPHVGHLPGAGLGLYLVQQVTQWHKGEVNIIPRPGGGTIFRGRLPRHP